MEEAIRRYQNDPVFHNFTDAIAGFLERGFIDRDGVEDALRVAEMIAFERAAQHSMKPEPNPPGLFSTQVP